MESYAGLLYILPEEIPEFTTSKPTSLSSVCQKGRFSYIFSPMGMPILPNGAFFTGLYLLSLSNLYWYALGRFDRSLLPNARSHRLPDIFFAITKHINSKFTVIGAYFTLSSPGFMGKIF